MGRELGADATPIQKLAVDPKLDRFLLVIILLNCLFMAMTNPTLGDDQQPLIIKVTTWLFNIIYVVETSVQLAAWGLVRYLVDPWHWLDFIVSSVSLIDIAIPIISAIGVFFNIGAIPSGGACKSQI